MATRVGLIGAGVMGTDHARLLTRAVAGVELIAVSDVDETRARAIADLSPAARLYKEPLTLIRDRTVDAVLVASPDETHASLVLACLDAGKPVLCEKPLAPSIKDCGKIIEREVALGKRLTTVGYMRRFDPGYVEMKRNLQSAKFGSALIMHCVHRNKVAPSFMTAPMIITNSAVHEFDIARHVLEQDVRRISIVKPRKSTLVSMQDPLIVLLEMSDGVVVDIEVYVNAQYGYDVRAELVCERGTISLAPPHVVTVVQTATAGFDLPDDWRARFMQAYQAELQAWIAGIKQGVPAGASAWDGYVATVIAQAGLQAFASGRAVEVTLDSRPTLYNSA